VGAAAASSEERERERVGNNKRERENNGWIAERERMGHGSGGKAQMFLHLFSFSEHVADVDRFSSVRRHCPHRGADAADDVAPTWPRAARF
jgi:hypothetical protein